MRLLTSSTPRFRIAPAPAAREPRGWLPWLVLPFICGGFFFYGLSAGELYRTESLRAIVAVEFLRSGNWIVPRLYGEPFFTKPPGSYAAIALASLPFGEVTEWSGAGLPAALAASILVLLFFLMFRRRLGGTAGLIAAACVPLSMMVLDKATSAEIDMLQVAWVASAIVCLPAIVERDSSGRGVWGWWLIALMCVTGGFLTKWTAPAFFYLTAGPFLCWRGQLRLLWSLPNLCAVVFGVAVCLIWAATAIGLEGWDTLVSTVRHQALMHLSSAHQQRAYPWYESLAHPFVIFGAALPISLFALPALTPAFMRKWDDRGRLLLQLFHCWLWPNLLLWTLLPAHNARQSFPLYPAIAGFAAMTWIAWCSGRSAWRWAAVTPIKALIGIMCVWGVVKLAFVHVVVPERLRGREPRAKACLLRSHVPENEILHVCRLKDEGIMFYYGRPVIRFPKVADLPTTRELLYCILKEDELRDLQRRNEVVVRASDQQGDTIALVKIFANVESKREP